MKAIEELVNLDGKVAIVTGGAAGIGEAIVRRLHEAGAQVVVADIVKEAADKLAAELNELRDGSAFGLGGDISQADAVDEIVRVTVEAFGGIDILVNNAGIYPMKLLAEMTSEDFMKVINVNLHGVFLTTKAVSEQMKLQGRGGKIINVTSIDALRPSMTGLAHYDASKHGVWGFTKNVALELAEYNIAVNAIAPGAVATPGTGAGSDVVIPGLEEMTARIPMKRQGEADEIGTVALFLASDMASYMTGSQVVVDGGRLLT